MGSTMREPEQPQFNPLFRDQLGEILDRATGDIQDLNKTDGLSDIPLSQQLHDTVVEDLKVIVADAAPDFERPPRGTLDDAGIHPHPTYTQALYDSLARRDQDYPKSEPGKDLYGRRFFPLPLGMKMVYEVLRAHAPYGKNLTITKFEKDKSTLSENCLLVIKDGTLPVFWITPQPGENIAPAIDGLLDDLFSNNAIEGKEDMRQIMRSRLMHVTQLVGINTNTISPGDRDMAAEDMKAIAEQLKQFYRSTADQRQQRYARYPENAFNKKLDSNAVIDNAVDTVLTELASLPPTA